MKIKNKKKFIKSILIILGLTVFLIILLSNKALSHKEVSYKTIYVASGDTLWNIAKEEQENNENYEGKDIRQIVNEIKKVNNLSSSSLSVGQKLLIIK